LVDNLSLAGEDALQGGLGYAIFAASFALPIPVGELTYGLIADGPLQL
jgi:hypothetical protein